MAVDILDPEMYPEDEFPLRFAPNCWAQERALESEAPELLYSGRLASSKSRTLCEKGDKRCRMFTPARVALTRLHREHVGNSTLPELLEQVISPSHRAWGWRRSADGGSTLYYPNGSQILVLGVDNPIKLQSTKFDLILIDQCEEVNREQWEIAGGRLRNIATYRPEDGSEEVEAPLQIFGACNPSTPEHFLFKKFRPDRGSHVRFTTEPTRLLNGDVMPAGRVMCETVCASPLDNVTNMPLRYQERLAHATGRFKEMMVEGKWVAYEGLVYDMWIRARHVVRMPVSWEVWGNFPPPHWDRVRGIDFGMVHPFSCVWLARSPAGRWYVYRQIYKTRTLPQDHARVIKKAEEEELAALRDASLRMGVIPPSSLPMMGSFADHDATERAIFEDLDVECSPADKGVEAGIATVSWLLQPHAMADGTVRPMLVVVENSLLEVDPYLADAEEPLCLEDEMGVYQFPKKRPVEREAKDAPEKAYDHACDALRYALHSVRRSYEYEGVAS